MCPEQSLAPGFWSMWNLLQGTQEGTPTPTGQPWAAEGFWGEGKYKGVPGAVTLGWGSREPQKPWLTPIPTARVPPCSPSPSPPGGLCDSLSPGFPCKPSAGPSRGTPGVETAPPFRAGGRCLGKLLRGAFAPARGPRPLWFPERRISAPAPPRSGPEAPPARILIVIGDDEWRGPFWLELCRRGSDARIWIPSPQLGGRNGTEGPALSPAPRGPPAQLQLHTCLALSLIAPQGHKAPHPVLETTVCLVSYGPGPGGPRSLIHVCGLGSGVAGLGPAGEDAPLPFRVPEASWLASCSERLSCSPLPSLTRSPPPSSFHRGTPPKGDVKWPVRTLVLGPSSARGRCRGGGGGTRSGPRSQQGAHRVPLPPPSPTTPSPTSARQRTSSSLPWSSGPSGSRTSQSCPWTTRSSC